MTVWPQRVVTKPDLVAYLPIQTRLTHVFPKTSSKTMRPTRWIFIVLATMARLVLQLISIILCVSRGCLSFTIGDVMLTYRIISIWYGGCRVRQSAYYDVSADIANHTFSLGSSRRFSVLSSRMFALIPAGIVRLLSKNYTRYAPSTFACRITSTIAARSVTKRAFSGLFGGVCRKLCRLNGPEHFLPLLVRDGPQSASLGTGR